MGVRPVKMWRDRSGQGSLRAACKRDQLSANSTGSAGAERDSRALVPASGGSYLPQLNGRFSLKGDGRGTSTVHTSCVTVGT